MELEVKRYGIQGAELIIKGDSVVVTEDVTRDETIIENLREVADDLSYILDSSFTPLQEKYDLLKEEFDFLVDVINRVESLEEVKEYL